MRDREYIITGQSNDEGGFMISDQLGMTEFFKSWPRVKFTCKFSVIGGEASPAIKGYYFNKVVPDFKKARYQNGEVATEEDTERWMRELSPIMWEEFPDVTTGKYTNRLREISELDNQEMVMLLDFLKQVAAEEFGFFIEDPSTYKN